jgi:hypothetical protein
MSNFPYGENIGNTVDVTNFIPTTLYWLSSKVAGPVCGYNLTVELGILFSALSMFLFIFWLTKDSLASFVGGYILAFNPYMQIKPQVHIGYAFVGIFALISWALLLYIKKPSIKRGVILGALYAASWYINGYFILLSSVLILCVLLAVAVTRLSRYSFGSEFLRIKNNIIIFSATLLSVLLFLTPIIVLTIKNTNEVSRLIQTSRGNIQQEATALSARPLEYVLPSDENPIFGGISHKYLDGLARGSNKFEYNMFIGWTNLALALWFIVISLKRKIKNNFFAIHPKAICIIFSITGVLAFLLSLPPHLIARGISIPMPSLFIINLTDFWRVFARFYILVILSVTILSMSGLSIVLRNLSSINRKVVAALLFGLLFFEFLTFWPQRPVWSYNSAPSSYRYLATSSNVTAVAEYPINEPPFPPSSLILSYQRIYKKPLLNSYLPSSPQSNLRSSVADLTDNESARILRGIGVSSIIVHAKTQPQNLAKDFELVNQDYDNYDKQQVFAYKITSGNIAEYALVAERGTDELDRVAGFPHHYYQIANRDVFEFLPLSQLQQTKPQYIKLQMRARGHIHVRINQGQAVLWEGDVKDAINLNISVSSPKRIEIHTNTGKNNPLIVSNVGVY